MGYWTELIIDLVGASCIGAAMAFAIYLSGWHPTRVGIGVLCAIVAIIVERVH